MPNFLYERYVSSGSTLPYRAWCQKNKTFQANEAKRRMGWYVPNEQHIHYVHLTAIPVPKNARTIKGLNQEQDCIWVRSLRLAKILVEMDHEHGGAGSYTTFEVRTCKVCGRMLSVGKQQITVSAAGGRVIAGIGHGGRVATQYVGLNRTRQKRQYGLA